MMGVWIAVALLAGSWLMGLDYFYPASPWAWVATVATAVALLGRSDRAGAETDRAWRGRAAAATILLLPAVWFAAWPYRAAPLLLAIGLATEVLAIRKRWLDRLACGTMAAGVVLLVQALALEVYASHTALSHELFWPLPNLLAAIAGLLGIDATANGSSVVLHSMRQIHRLAATWELLFDPATFLFFVGGLTMLAIKKREGGRGKGEENKGSETGNDTPKVPSPSLPATSSSPLPPPPSPFSLWSAWIRAARTFSLIVLAWLPVRAGLMMALYLHRVLRSDPNRPLHAMNHFFSPWLLLLLLAVPVLLAWRFVRAANGERATGDGGNAEPGTRNEELEAHQATTGGPAPLSPRPSPFAPLLVAVAVAFFTAAIYWSPVGPRRQGRVMVVERHSQWEPTTKPYDTKWFVEPRLFDEGSGYNYAAMYAYLGTVL